MNFIFFHGKDVIKNNKGQYCVRFMQWSGATCSHYGKCLEDPFRAPDSL